FRYAAGYDSVHQVAVAEELGVGPQQVFLQPPELEKAERKRDIVAEVAEVTEVVGDALELEQDAAQRQRAPRRLGPGCAFDRHRPRPGRRDSGQGFGRSAPRPRRSCEAETRLPARLRGAATCAGRRPRKE